MEKLIRYLMIGCLFVLCSGQMFHAYAAESEGTVDVTELIFDHIGDSYDWHIATVGGRHISVHLPVIVYSRSSGLHCFSSRHLSHGEYLGFYIATEGDYAGKVVENVNGNAVRPVDISITKNVCSLLVASLILLLLILGSASWYRRHDPTKESPKGLAAMLEPLVMMISDMCRESIGEDDYRKFEPYICTAFFFILINNFLGIVPFFPGGANVTGNISITLVLALCTFMAINLFGNRHYYKDIFWPDVPWWLKFPVPLLPMIEVFSACVKAFSLMVRLFANVMAGHILILSLCGVIFIVAKMGPVVSGSMTFMAVLFGIFMDVLECVVAFVQAYVFAMLSAAFIGAAHAKE